MIGGQAVKVVCSDWAAHGLVEVDKIEDVVHFVVVAILVAIAIALPLHVEVDWTVLDVSQTFGHSQERHVEYGAVEPVLGDF